VDPEGESVTYIWSFGRSGANATFSYSAPGEYTESVKVTDPKGLTGSTTLIVEPTLEGSSESTEITTTTTTVATTTTEAETTSTLGALPPDDGSSSNSGGLPTWAFPAIGVGAVAVLVGIIALGFRLSSKEGGAIAVGGIGTRMGVAFRNRRRQWADWWMRTKLAMSSSRRKLFSPLTRQRAGMPFRDRIRIGGRASRSRLASTKTTVEGNRRFWYLSLRNLFRFRKV
jgi:hypothetical protein